MAVSNGKFELPERPSHPQVPEELDLGSDNYVGLESRSQPETDDAFQAWIRSLLDWNIDGICDTKRHTSPHITNPLDEEKRLPDWQAEAGNFSRSTCCCHVTTQGILEAKCQMLDGEYHLSSMSLKSIIMGLNGEFHWLDGTIRSPSCQISDASNWHLVSEREAVAHSFRSDELGFCVHAQCMDDSGGYKDWFLTLDEKISNDNGRLKLITPLGRLVVPLFTDYHVSTIAIALVMGLQHRDPTVKSEEIESQVQNYLQSQDFAQSSKCPLAESHDAKAATLISLMWIRFCREYTVHDLIKYRDICKAIHDRLRDQPPPSHELKVMLEHYREMPSHLKRHAISVTEFAHDSAQMLYVHEAIHLLQMLLEVIAEDDGWKPYCGQMLIQMVLYRYRATSECDDLRKACALAEKFCNTQPRDGNIKACDLMNLALCKWEEDKLSGEQKNRISIAHAMEEAERCSIGLVKLAVRQNRCIYYMENLSTFEPFDHAELYQKLEWLDVAPTDIVAEGDEVPAQMDIAHWRYKAAGFSFAFLANPEDLTLIDRAVEYMARSCSALETARAKYALSDEVFASGLVAHAGALAIRFRITEASDDLIRIIEAFQRALTLYGSLSMGRANLLRDLAVHQLLLHEREGALETHGDVQSSAGNLLLDAYNNAKAAYLSSLQVNDAYGSFAHTYLQAWELCFGAVGDWSFLDEAIRIAEDSHTKILYKNNACTLLESTKCRLLFRRYLLRRSPSAYDEAMDAARRHSQRNPLAVIAGPNEVIDIMGHAMEAFRVKAHSLQEVLPYEDVAFVMQQCDQILDLNRAQARHRITAGIILGTLWGGAWKDWVAANKSYEKTISLFTRLITRSLLRADREYLLKRLSTDLPTHASFAACYAAEATGSSAEEVALATLQRLESSRGMLARLVFQSRLNQELILSKDEKAADQYNSLLKQLTSLEAVARIEGNQTSNSNDEMRTAALIQRRTKILERLSELEVNLKAKTEDISLGFLKGLVGKSALVQVVANTDTAIAILVTAAGLRLIKLQELKSSDVAKNLDRLYGSCRLSKAKPLQVPQAGQELSEILKWLWDKAVKLILSELGYYPHPKRCHRNRLPRLWWSATGITSKLPFHAAGGGAEGVNGENVYDYAVCSYTPSLTALKMAQDCTAPSKEDFIDGMLAVSMPTTPGPGWVPLKTEEELRSIKDSSGLTPTCLTNPRKSDVVERLSEHSIVHFICHGTSMARNPSSSALVLGQQRASFVEHLTVKELCAIGLKKARIAYLSACSTAENSSYELSDESIHVANAFQLAGFSHVIATLWEAKDRVAIPLAGLFYQELTGAFAELETFDSNHDIVAYALHNALYKVRNNKSSRNSLCWAPFIHLGA